MSHQDSRRRAEEAFRLRSCGRTWAEISEELGYRSRDGARLAVARYVDRQPAQSANAVRRSATEGLRVVRAVLFERFADAKERSDNDDLVMLAREIRNNTAETAKLHGAYAPQRTEIDVTVHQSATAILDRAESDLLALAAERHTHRFPSSGNVIDAEVIGE